MTKKLISILSLILFAVHTPAQCWKNIDGGHMFSIATKDDGTLWGWGGNTSGQLGTGNYNYEFRPNKSGNENTWNYVSAAYYFSMGIKNDGSLWAWGSNTQGQLGLGTSEIRYNIPTRVGNGNNWKNISTGGYYTMAIKSDGSLWGWGDNANGQLGDGTTVDKNIPVRIGIDTDWKMVDAGESYTVAIKNDGTIWSWGSYVSLAYPTEPEQVGTDNNWKFITTDGNHTMAIKNDNSLWAWGWNDLGQLGDGTNMDRHIPTRIGNDNDWKIVTTGVLNTKAIKNDGSLWAWGRNDLGQLGDGTNNSKNIPTRIGSSNDWDNVFTGMYHTLATKDDGSLWSWGFNMNAQLGDGTLVDKNLPVQITPACSPLSVSDINDTPIQVHPNPIKDYFIINTKKVKQVHLYSLDGKILKEYSVLDKYYINGLAKGIYILKIQLENGKTISEKIIKE